MTDLTGVRVAIIATDGFEESELDEPRLALIRCQAETYVVAPDGDSIQGMEHDTELRRKIPVDLQLKDIRPEDFDAVHLPGGTVNADRIRTNSDLQAFLRAMDGAHKTISAICHAPWALISAGLVQGRTLTSYPSLADDVFNAGGEWVDQAVVEDRNWITSRRPDDLAAFNESLIRHFAARVPGRRHVSGW